MVVGRLVAADRAKTIAAARGGGAVAMLRPAGSKRICAGHVTVAAARCAEAVRAPAVALVVASCSERVSAVSTSIAASGRAKTICSVRRAIVATCGVE